LGGGRLQNARSAGGNLVAESGIYVIKLVMDPVARCVVLGFGYSPELFWTL
jgi:hypothetical protein